MFWWLNQGNENVHHTSAHYLGMGEANKFQKENRTRESVKMILLDNQVY